MATSSDAAEWRSSYGAQSPRPAARVSFLNSRRKLLGSTRVPISVQNTRSLSCQTLPLRNRSAF